MATDKLGREIKIGNIVKYEDTYYMIAKNGHSYGDDEVEPVLDHNRNGANV